MGLDDITLADAGKALSVCAGAVAPLALGFAKGHSAGTGSPSEYLHLLVGGPITGVSFLLLKDEGGIMGMFELPKPAVFAIGSVIGYGLEAVGFGAGYVVGRF
ncbi:MAG TPA: hypothetical protein VJK52_03105 [Candidatus Nanoarchaeia archaeon]|nr:hypothetical protein [Candidatus Nanoarchaeia archaeon]